MYTGAYCCGAFGNPTMLASLCFVCTRTNMLCELKPTEWESERLWGPKLGALALSLIAMRSLRFGGYTLFPPTWSHIFYTHTTYNKPEQKAEAILYNAWRVVARLLVINNQFIKNDMHAEMLVVFVRMYFTTPYQCSGLDAANSSQCTYTMYCISVFRTTSMFRCH